MSDISQININNTIYNFKDAKGRTQVEIMPAASADLLGKIYQFIGATGTYTNGYFYKCVPGSTAGIYEWIPVAVQEGGGSSVQSDWNQTDSTADDFIKNKPNVIEQTDTMPTASVDNYLKTYLYIGIPTEGFEHGSIYQCWRYSMSPPVYAWSKVTDAKNVQPDWGQTDSTADDFIKNKPILGTASAKDVATSGDASATQVVMGNDSRLNNLISATATTSPITDSADGMVQGLMIYGRSHKSKNLLDPDNPNNTMYGITEVHTSEDLTLTATEAGSWNQYVYDIHNNTDIRGKTVNLSVDDVIQSSARCNWAIFIAQYIGDTKTTVGSISPSRKSYSATLDNATTGMSIVVIVSQSRSVQVGDYITVKKLQLEFGTEQTTYEPYFEGIHSVGDNGLTVITANSDNTLTTSAEFITALPLRSTLDGATRDELIIGNGKAEVITRCEVVDDSIVPLATPITTPLTDAEISAFRSLRTYDSTTNITIFDDPEFELDYLKNTENGQAVADIQRDLQGQIDEGSGSANFPAGGTTGQALVKASDADNDVEWGNISSVRIDDTTPSASTVFSSRKTDILIKTPMTGASQYADGTVGAVPQPLSGDDQKALFGDGTYHTIYTSASGSTIIVKTTEASLYGRTVTLSMGTQSLTATIGATGEATFTSVSFYGTVNVVADDGNGNYARGSANLTYFGTYVVSLTMNFATLNFISDNAALVGKNLDLKIGNKTITTFQLSLVAGTTDTYMGTVYVDRLATYKVDTMTDAGRVRGTVVADAYTTYNATVSTGEIYAFKINHNDSNPATCVTPYENEYGCDNLNFTPAHMDYTNDTFDYGSWTGQEFFFPKPCMLKYDGTVDYYLDPNDYSLRTDGTPSDVADMSYAGNVMIEFPTVYFKRWQEGDYSYCIISDKQLGADFHAYAHHDVNGDVLPYIYLSAYDGAYDGTRMRSISGCGYNATLVSGNVMCQTTRQQEMNFAMANNLTGYTGEGWYIRHKADWDMVNDLLILIGMSTDTQTTFGRGNDNRGTNGCIGTGTMDNKGLFWGSNDGTSGVKVFGIENWWANNWKSIAGWINANGTQKVKMTYGREDGSTIDGFNLDGTGYVAISNSTPTGTNGGCINTYYATEYGMIPKNANGSATTYLCDGIWWNNSQINFARVGGNSVDGTQCGAFYTGLSGLATYTTWGGGADLIYKGIVSQGGNN